MATPAICCQVADIQPRATKVFRTHPPRTPAVTPARTPNPISSATTRRGSRSSTPSSASAMVRKMISSGTQMPSLSPLSTLSPWRIRDGSRLLLTTGCPNAASVGARMVASAAAVQMLRSGRRSRAATVPATMVRGRPTPSSRTGSWASRRSPTRLIRTASVNSISASVASARWRRNWFATSSSTNSRAWFPTSRPTRTNTMAWLTREDCTRSDTAAYPTRSTARVGSAQSPMRSSAVRSSPSSVHPPDRE